MSELDFRNYLQSLLNPSAQDWGDRYTPTEAELPLKVQTVTSRQNDLTQEGQRESPKRYEVLAGLREYAADYVLLVGKPGSGKSTALRRLLWEEAQKALSAIENGQSNFTIPVLIELRDRREGSVIIWIQKALRKVTRDETAIEDLLFAGRCLLLFDGLNEIPLPEMWSTLDEFQRDRDFFRNPRVFTTRELGAGSDLGIEKKLEMLPLTDTQMQEFIELRLPGQSENLLRQLKDRLRELAETPLILKMLCDVVRESPDGQLPQNRGELFRLEFARRYEEFKSLRGKVSERLRLLTPKLLQHLAFVMTQGEPHTDPCKPTPSWLSIPKSTAATILATYLANEETPSVEAEVEMMSWLEAMISHHLLQLATNPDEIEFRHQLFQEYYAAEKLLELLPTLSDDELKQDYLNYLKWTEAITITSFLFQKEVQAIKIVQIGLTVDWRLGAKLSGKVRQEFQEKTVGLVNVLQVPDWVKVELWGLTESEYALFPLLQILETEDSILRSDALFALPNTYLEPIIPSLISLLHDIDGELAWGAAELLSTMRSEQLLPSLLMAINDSKASVRIRAAFSLMDAGFEQSVPPLLKALEDEDPKVRETATNSLEEISLEKQWISSEQAILLLLQRLKDCSSEVRCVAAEMLKSFDLEQSILGLCEALEDEDCYVREAVTLSLTELCPEKALPGLLELLGDEKSFGGAITILMQSGLEVAVPVMLKVLEDGNATARERVAYAFGATDSDHAIPGIELAFEDPDVRVRRAVAEALALEQFDSERAIPTLLKALEDIDSEVRESAAFALGGINSETAVTGLLKALNDQDLDVRQTAVQSLIDLNQEHLIPEILKATINKPVDFHEESNSLQELGENQDVRYILLPGLLGKLASEPMSDQHKYLFREVLAIQSHCGFYNYEIAQAAAERCNRQKAEGEIERMKIANVYIESLEKLEVQEVGNMFTGTIEIQGDQVAVKYELPQQEGECSE